MEIKEFIENFANQFEDTDPALFKPETIFRNLDEWGSMSVLSLIAMADEEYGVELDPEDFKKANTVQDLFDIIKAKKT